MNNQYAKHVQFKQKSKILKKYKMKKLIYNMVMQITIKENK